jgi:hypothetical protein
MKINLVSRKTEGNVSPVEFQRILDALGGLYSNGIAFIYDKDQGAVVVKKGDSLLGNVRCEGALHTIIWAALSVAEKEG